MLVFHYPRVTSLDMPLNFREKITYVKLSSEDIIRIASIFGVDCRGRAV
jgi:hypothetical protein